MGKSMRADQMERAMLRQLYRMEGGDVWEANEFLTTASPRRMEERCWVKSVAKDGYRAYYQITAEGRQYLAENMPPDMPLRREPRGFYTPTNASTQALFDFVTWLRMEKGITLARWQPDDADNATLAPVTVPITRLIEDYFESETAE